MEIELKYSISSEEVAEAIWQDKLFEDMEEDNSREELCMDAKYYDTEDYRLSREKLSYRVRKEGQRWVSTLKWKGTNDGALHQREELCVPVLDETPDVSVFKQSEKGRELMELAGDSELKCIIETKIHRKKFRIDTGTGLFEISVDSGKIITPFGQEPISEVEVELFSGETEELVEIGKKLVEKYDLEIAENSKYARGINMIKLDK